MSNPAQGSSNIFKNNNQAILRDESLLHVTDKNQNTIKYFTKDFDDYQDLKRCTDDCIDLVNQPDEKASEFSLKAQQIGYDQYLLYDTESLTTLMQTIKVFNRLHISNIDNANPYLQLLHKFFRCFDLSIIVQNKDYYNGQEINLIHAVCDAARELMVYRKTEEFKNILKTYIGQHVDTREQLYDYIDEVFKRNSRFSSLRIDLHYEDCINHLVTFEQVQEDNEAFIAELKEYYGNNLKGYVWKLEYGRQRGFFIKYLIFIHGVKKDITVCNIIGSKFWVQKATQGIGTYANRNIKKDHEYLAVGIVEFDQVNARIGFKNLVDAFTTIDLYTGHFLQKDQIRIGVMQLKEMSKRGRPRKDVGPDGVVEVSDLVKGKSSSSEILPFWSLSE